jgi:hypothetical protein
MKRLIATVVVTLGLLLGFGGIAHAGGNSTLPDGTSSALSGGGPCGSAYTHIGHYPIKSGGTTFAHLDVYWSWSSRRNCLVTNHYGSTYGVSLYTEAKIRPTGWSWPSCPNSTGCDGGFYSYYAGPVYTPSGVNMTNRCIDISGWIAEVNRTLTKIHCG